jgi:hypothetical protein
MIELISSDHSLDTSFLWAKKTALGYVRDNDPVGKWYEAALPGRESFCMRDVSHQSTGAYYLGLESYTKNMLLKFTQNISSTRDWCSYWEITKDDKPTPVDYKSDSVFWYDLPSNFDVMKACYKMYLLTGDSTLLLSNPFYSFAYHSVHEYPAIWDLHHNGMMSALNETTNGIGSYVESIGGIATGSDLLAAQAEGYNVYGHIMQIQNKPDSALYYYQFAKKLKADYIQNWWNVQNKNFYNYEDFSGMKHMNKDNAFGFLILTLHFDLIKSKDNEKMKYIISCLEKGIKMGDNVESHSYLSLILYKYDRSEAAYKSLLFMIDPSVKRRTYPEVSYAFIGTIVEGLMGIELNAPKNTIVTTSKLPKKLKWVQVKYIPWKTGYVTVRHDGLKSTTLSSGAKQSFIWRATFSGNQKELWVNGKAVKTRLQTNLNGGG